MSYSGRQVAVAEANVGLGFETSNHFATRWCSEVWGVWCPLSNARLCTGMPAMFCMQALYPLACIDS
ncbi:hypothetical protein M405DRAFT_831686 [Rhizopogon salebrosus TDB-379]|nr:hypothetical protein M405DRAFT_831686 [Rhizopogon salebrosus TDB-379]